jgi:methylthioribulose-1-phosphate dehydratase
VQWQLLISLPTAVDDALTKDSGMSLISDDFLEVAWQLAEVGRGFSARGWVLGTSGNFSAVVNRTPLRLAMSPSGIDKGALSADQIVLIDECAKVISKHEARPSDESPLHVRLASEKGAGAVLHTHSVWSTTLSDLHAPEGGLAIEGYEMLKGLEGVKTHEHREWVPIIENSQDMKVLAEEVSKMLRAHPKTHGFLLRRHGLYTWGKDLAQAKRHVEIFEFLLEAVGRMRLMRAGVNQ